MRYCILPDDQPEPKNEGQGEGGGGGGRCKAWRFEGSCEDGSMAQRKGVEVGLEDGEWGAGEKLF